MPPAVDRVFGCHAVRVEMANWILDDDDDHTTHTFDSHAHIYTELKIRIVPRKVYTTAKEILISADERNSWEF